MHSKRNYFTIALLTILFNAQYFGNIEFCDAYMLGEGDPCKDPAEACREEEDGVLVYNPENCHQSYACIKDYAGNVVPSDDPLTCSDGLTFDYYGQNCSSEASSCNKACVNKACDFECLADGDGYVADVNDCNIYYFCYHGVISSPAYCPDSNPYFDGKKCSDKKYSCCDTCTPYCTSDDYGRNIPDSFDCTSYYTCESGVNYPDEDEHYHCPEGQYFDSDNRNCTESAENCKNICDYVSTTAKSSTKSTTVTKITSQSTATTEKTIEPSTTESSASEQSSIEPLTSDHSTSNPSTAETPTTKASTIVSSSFEQSTNEASTAESSFSGLSTIEPSTAESSFSGLSTIEPSTAESSFSGLSTIEPSTAESSFSGLSTIEPSTAESSNSEQSTIKSSTEESPTSEKLTSKSSTEESLTSEQPITKTTSVESSTSVRPTGETLTSEQATSEETITGPPTTTPLATNPGP